MTDITLENFETALIHASMTQPVLLDIWAPWCGPCKALGPLLDKLEADYGGRFVVAKLNSDEQPEIAGQLSQAFGVRSIPFCVLFAQGAPVDGFVGALPEAQIRAFLDKHVPSEGALDAEADLAEAEALAADGAEPEEVQARLRAALAADPANDTARFDLSKLLLAEGQASEARALLAEVPGKALVDSRFAAAELWLAALDAVAAEPRDEAALRAAIATDRRDFAARLALAQRLMAAQQWPAAMDELLEIIMRDKAWGDEAARKLYVAILELMAKPAPRVNASAGAGAGAADSGKLELAGHAAVTPADPVLDAYRRKLSMALF